jgi:hypothetical protein
METSSATATTLAPPAGILRRRSSFVSNNSRSNSPNSSRTSMGVHFAPPPNLSELLSSHDFPALEGFITHMRNQQGEALVAWLQALAENMTLLKPKLEPFVLATLDISWAGRSQVCVAAFTQYLTNLLTAQGFYTKPIMMMLVRHLGGGVGSVEDPAEQERVFHNVHSAIKAALDASPLGARTALLSYAKESMPFMLSKNPKAQSAYLKNLMEMSFYVKRDDDRLRLLTLVVDRLVQLDAYLPKLEEEEEDEDTDEQFDMEVETPGRIILDDSSLAQLNLDEAMTMMFEVSIVIVGRPMAHPYGGQKSGTPYHSGSYVRIKRSGDPFSQTNCGTPPTLSKNLLRSINQNHQKIAIIAFLSISAPLPKCHYFLSPWLKKGESETIRIPN